MTTPESYSWLFSNGLDKLTEELKAYKHDDDLWVVSGAIKNSAGNLAQHLVGNLKTFVGREMGGFPYMREREREFNERLFERSVLLQMIDETKEIIIKTLSGKDAVFLAQLFPAAAVNIKEGQTFGFMLTYLYAHLNYHLGQINYHRRLLNDTKKI